jgi:predicted metal-dependent phosphoesterase TrpH
VTSLWNCDLHSHTLWSKDCLSDFERIIEICQRRGIDRLAITDHNTADGALKMQQLAPDLIIVGEEIMTTQGEIRQGNHPRQTHTRGNDPPSARSGRGDQRVASV